MLTLMKVQCPHCGIEGQVMAPNAGTLIVGPCPECHRLVAIFAGEALPLDDTIMNGVSIEDKYNHVKKVLFDYVESRVRNCFTLPSDMLPGDADKQAMPPPAPVDPLSDRAPISEAEMRRFMQQGINELDNPEFFEKLF